MPAKKTDTRELRRIAEGFVRTLPDEIGRPDTDPDELVTSLIRQWLTYDGHATFLADESRQVYADLIKSPLGKIKVRASPVSTEVWLRSLKRDWKIGSEEMAEVIDQLNRAQSAEVVNADGLQLRLWVNPKDRSRGIEPVNWDDIEVSASPDYPTIAANVLEAQLFNERLSRDAILELANGVAEQWKQYDGHACVFIDERRALTLRYSKGDAGACRVSNQTLNADFVRTLAPYGIPGGRVSDVLGRINRGEQVEIRDRTGARSRLGHDPKSRRFFVQPLDPGPGQRPPLGPPILCPRCTGVLQRWQEGVRQQTCRFCGHTVSVP